MDADLARRFTADVLSVCQKARPTSAALWVGALALNLPECARSRSLRAADQRWARSGARFRTTTHAIVSLPPTYTACAREMYCRNVYLRTGLTMPRRGWVIDLGANHGLFSIWAAVTGADVVAVEAQQGFAKTILDLAEYNGVADRVHIEMAMASGTTVSGATVGVAADDQRWAQTSDGAPVRPADLSMPQLISSYRIDRINLLKVDIEGGEFAVFADADLHWLEKVDQIALEVHHDFGYAPSLIARLRNQGFTIDLRDNNGRRAAAASPQLAYAYCSRL